MQVFNNQPRGMEFKENKIIIPMMACGNGCYMVLDLRKEVEHENNNRSNIRRSKRIAPRYWEQQGAKHDHRYRKNG